METIRKQHFARPYMWSVVCLGAVAFALNLYSLQPARLDLGFLLVALLTLGFGSRLVVQIPHVKGQVTVSDTFVLLTILLYDGEAAVLLAAADAFCSCIRINRKWFVIGFNTGAIVCSTFVTVWALRFFFGDITLLPYGSYSSTYIMALCLMAFVQYVLNSGTISTGVALRAGQPLWKMWRDNFLWTSITYFAGASAAGIIAKLVGVLGIYALLSVGPIIAVVYFTYCTYLKNVEVSASKAELAQRNVEQAQQHLEALRVSEERFRSAFDYATIGMALVSPRGRCLQVNPSLCGILGYTEQELLDCDSNSLIHPDDFHALRANVKKLLTSSTPSYQTEMRYMHKGGHVVWALLGLSIVRDAQGEPSHLLYQVQDITDRKRAEEQLLHDAFHDMLTGLPNRALFIDHLKMAIQRSRRNEGKMFAALFLDLDRFKVINDSLGHMLGDQLLVGIARRLEACLRPGDTVARLGGDEFVVLVEDIADTNDAAEIAGRIQEELSQPFNLGGHEVFTTVSIGIAPSSAGYERAEDLLRDADTAMYRAKTLGKKRYEIFDRAMHDRALKLLQLETDLRRAVDRAEFALHYQPIISLDSGRVRGFEALVRWVHPERGFISPDDFIPVAEETGLIIPIGQWVLEEACRQARAWQESHPSDLPLTISVNLSGKQFSQPDLIERVRGVLRETNLDARHLKLEITESMVMENIETAVEMLTQLRALGVEISIDDFGTGYSSLSYLHRFPINTLKIDRSFVSHMTENTENAEIVRTIITLARSLEMDVVAEGVETAEQLQQLKDLDCDYAQGFLFSKPLPREAASSFLDEHASSVLLPAPNSLPQHSLAA
ncbi:MAG TPA: EAL domain-containing protein [Pyrinomonadaceae bacterium]|nr:EAL domain-containing protein [Pyrinomonadaceae bacterium]